MANEPVVPPAPPPTALPPAPAPVVAPAPTPVIPPTPQMKKIQPAREVTGNVRQFKIPDTVYRHPNPVGRPKNHRGK